MKLSWFSFIFVNLNCTSGHIHYKSDKSTAFVNSLIYFIIIIFFFSSFYIIIVSSLFVALG